MGKCVLIHLLGEHMVIHSEESIFSLILSITFQNTLEILFTRTDLLVNSLLPSKVVSVEAVVHSQIIS